MDILLAALDRRCPSQRAARLFAAVLVLIAMGFIAAGFVTANITALQVTFGALAGLLLFSAGYVIIAHGASRETAEKWNFRSRMPLPRRRWLAFWIVLAWILLLIVFGRFATSTVIIGALNVAVLLGIWRLGSMTEGERIFAEIEAQQEEEVQWSAEEEVDIYEDEVDYEETDWPEGDPGEEFIQEVETK